MNEYLWARHSLMDALVERNACPLLLFEIRLYGLIIQLRGYLPERVGRHFCQFKVRGSKAAGIGGEAVGNALAETFQIAFRQRGNRLSRCSVSL